MMRIGSLVAVVGLATLHLAVVCAGFAAPYDFAQQDRERVLAPPTSIHFVDAYGRFHLRPFVYQQTTEPTNLRTYRERPDARYPVRFFVRGSTYSLLGFRGNVHLFGVNPPAALNLLGTDGFGRDVFSRVVYGGQISLFCGLLATCLSLSLGVLFGGVAGFYGRWVDAGVMRLAELFLALPWLYVLLALRAFLPLRITPTQAFVLLIGVIGLVGWARPARLVRGLVLSAKERGYVVAARGFGGSDWYLLRRHIFPQAYGALLTQATLLIPQYILAEVTLSYLGLGVGEPVASWGGMLAGLQQYHVMVSCWWMFFPGLVLIPIFVAYVKVSSALEPRCA
jgi:peptide/nickel transport system permease protein